jgi:hypothetical protein
MDYWFFSVLLIPLIFQRRNFLQYKKNPVRTSQEAHFVSEHSVMLLKEWPSQEFYRLVNIAV